MYTRHACVEKSPSIKIHQVTDPFKKNKSKFNFSQTVGEMVFVSFEVEKMRIFLVQSIVCWCWVLVRSCEGSVPISASQLAEL